MTIPESVSVNIAIGFSPFYLSAVIVLGTPILFNLAARCWRRMECVSAALNSQQRIALLPSGQFRTQSSVFLSQKPRRPSAPLLMPTPFALGSRSASPEAVGVASTLVATTRDRSMSPRCLHSLPCLPEVNVPKLYVANTLVRGGRYKGLLVRATHHHLESKQMYPLTLNPPSLRLYAKVCQSLMH